MTGISSLQRWWSLLPKSKSHNVLGIAIGLEIIDRQLPFEYTIASRSTDVMMALPILNINHSAFRSMFEREKLSETNFNDLFRSLKLDLRVEKKLFVIEQPIPPAPPADSIAQSMTPELHRQFENSATYDMIKELKSMFEKQVGVERFDLIQTFHTCKQDEGKSVSSYVLKMKRYVEQLERLGYVLSQDISVGLILNGLTSDFAGFAATPQVMAIQGGRIQKANKKSLNAKGNGKGKGKGKDKPVYIRKPKNPKPSAKEHPTKDDACHHCKEGCEALVKRDTLDKLQQRSVKCIFIGYLKETIEVSGRAEELKEIQDKDTSPSEDTSKIPMEVEGFELPQEEVVPFVVGRCYECGMQSMKDNQVWCLVDLPPNCKTVGSKWLFKKNTNMDGIVHTYKTCIVAKGYTQTYGVDYEETFSFVADISAIRILIAIAAFYDYEIWQMDVKTVFLNGHLNEDIYMVQPEGFVDHNHPKKASRSNVTFLILYVDDIIIMGNHIPSLQSVKSYLGKCFAMKDLGEVAFILGIKIYRDRSKRLIGLSQSAYMDKILKRFRMDTSKRGYIPMQERLDLNKTQGVSTPEEVKRMQNVPYASAVGSIIYAVRCTRLDVAFAQNLTSCFQQNPRELHWTAMKTILKYLRDTEDMFLVYGAVDWKSSKQSTTAMSATEAEYIAASEAAMEVVWIRKFISGLDKAISEYELLKNSIEGSSRRLFYLAIPPSVYPHRVVSVATDARQCKGREAMDTFRLQPIHTQVRSIKDRIQRACVALFDQDNQTFTESLLLNLDNLEKQLDREEFHETESIEYTGTEIQQFRDTLIQHMESVKKFIDERAQHKRENNRRVNDRVTQSKEGKVDSSKALDAGLVVTESNETESERHVSSSRSGKDTHDEDADINSVNDKQLLAEVQLTVQHDTLANEQQHFVQSEPIYDTHLLEKVWSMK
ncbi:retrotransposon protein, putative, ty1-copia subclass [Tanacetum coccineum]|uniref:Retrotransposon protein, putative, ty1-copia subclass n=1 Tax=Tanacetum coccineum TaxID=301880 RepID=A0ABQ5A5R8_9ASTR